MYITHFHISTLWEICPFAVLVEFPCPLSLWVFESCVDGIRKQSPERGLLCNGPLIVPGQLLFNRNVGELLNRQWGLEYTSLMTSEKSKYQSQSRVKDKWPGIHSPPEKKQTS